MSIDYKIYIQKGRGFRHLKHHPRYFQEGPKKIPSFGNLFLPEEKSIQEKIEQEKKEKSQRKESTKPSDKQQKLQSNPLGQSLKTKPLERQGEIRGDRRERSEKSKKEELEKLQLDQQKLAEQSHYQQSNDRRQIENRGSSLLQTVYSLTSASETSADKGFLAKENLPHFTKESLPSSDQLGKRLGDLRNFIGENGAMTREQWSQRSNSGNRRIGGQAFTHDRPFAGLGGNQLSNPLKTSNIFNELLKQLRPENHSLFINQMAQAAVTFQSKNLLQLKDGDRLRWFRLLDDGTLFELNTEHQGKPLSAEARRSISQALKERNLQARLHGEREILGEKGKTEGGKAEKDGSLSARGELKALLGDESSFAHLLRAALEEGREVGEHLGDGADPEYISKKDWNAFFARMLKADNGEESSAKSFDEIMSFIFRGVFKNGEEDRLVSDIKYMLEGKQREDKFAQISISDNELLDALRNLQPGETISKEMLQDFLGNELNFIKLVHLIGKADPGYASEILKNVKFNPSAHVDPYSQARLEHHIFSQSKRKEPGENTGVFADPFKLQEKPKIEFFGANPKLYTLIAYLAAGCGILLLLFYLLK